MEDDIFQENTITFSLKTIVNFIIQPFEKLLKTLTDSAMAFLSFVWFWVYCKKMRYTR